MNSRTTRSFWKQFDALPTDVRDQARKAFRLWRDDTAHPSLHFKRVHADESLDSVCVTRGYRAPGLLEGDTVTWFWIGSHADHERIISYTGQGSRNGMCCDAGYFSALGRYTLRGGRIEGRKGRDSPANTKTPETLTRGQP